MFLKLGAKPPSSPTPVEYPFDFKIFLRAAKVSLAICIAWAKLVAPIGIIIYSWKSTLLSAWAPPFTTFIIGIGSLVPFPSVWNNGLPFVRAFALATAKLTDKIAFAPRFVLYSVPSKSSMIWSISFWRETSFPISFGAIILFTFSQAVKTPLPLKRDSPSLSSKASRSPVEAPLGTIAVTFTPLLRVNSHSTVGLPRLSITS